MGATDIVLSLFFSILGIFKGKSGNGNARNYLILHGFSWFVIAICTENARIERSAQEDGYNLSGAGRWLVCLNET
jgi:hypothetical protein